MAQRTSLDAVEAILGPNMAEGTDLQPFIDTATAIVDGVEECADGGLSETKLELIERWLSAHCYAQMDQTKASKGTEGASASYHGQTGMFLRGTKYGQMALTLDSTGCLSSLTDPDTNTRVTAGGFWAGRKPSDQTDYDDR